MDHGPVLIYNSINYDVPVAVRLEVFLPEHLKELDFWNNYKKILQEMREAKLSEIDKLKQEITASGFEYKETPIIAAH